MFLTKLLAGSSSPNHQAGSSQFWFRCFDSMPRIPQYCFLGCPCINISAHIYLERITWLTFHPVSVSSFQCLHISKALLINLNIINIIVSLLLDLHAPKFKLTFAVVAELSPPSSIDLDAFNMTTLDDMDLLSFRAFFNNNSLHLYADTILRSRLLAESETLQHAVWV